MTIFMKMFSKKSISVTTLTTRGHYLISQYIKEESMAAKRELKKDVDIKEMDIFRDTPVRLLGYANEVGEAFRAQISKWSVRATYGVSSCYVMVDSVDKGIKASKIPNQSSRDQRNRVLLAVGDTMMWQGLASVIIPGATINRLCWASRLLFVGALAASPRHSAASAMPVINWLVTGVGLGTIPFIVHPIDKLVEWGMERTVRSYYSRLIPGGLLGVGGAGISSHAAELNSSTGE